MDIKAGSRLAHYDVISPLGAGGMGEVYEARDTRLGRIVALKVLPLEYGSNEERLRRFIQEARTASALNHPNIVAIHDVGEADLGGQRIHYIAMELIDGVTLRAKIHEEKSRLKQLLRYLAQAADGIAKAHAAGIVHRDLKPDNIMITREGQAKILDFGLAKLTVENQFEQSPDAATRVKEGTREGIVMGSVGYMSPEQVEGRAVDARTDIFSFGCILYEAITHRRPFTGKTNLDVLHAVVHTDPASVTELNPEAPIELRRIVKRCLAKEPEARYQSIRDLASQLHDLVDEYDTLTPGSGSTSMGTVPGRKRDRRMPFIVATAVLLLAAASIFAWKQYGRKEVPLRVGPVTPVTTSGNVWNASISPDGKYVVMGLENRGLHRVVVRQLATGSEVEVRPAMPDVAGPARFTRDGNYMYLTRYPVAQGRASYLEMLPILGGPARRVLDDISSSVSISPDEKTIAFRRYNREKQQIQLILANIDGSDQKIIATIAPPESAGTPQFSPDGNTIAWPWSTTKGGLHANILLLSTDGKQRRELLTTKFFNVNSTAWRPDGRGLWVVGADTESYNQLWHVTYPDGVLKRLTNDTNDYGGPLITADGRTILLVLLEQRTRLWRVFNDGTVEAVTPESEKSAARGFAMTAEGDIIYSGGTGQLDLMRLSPGKSPQKITDLPGSEYNPAVGSRSGNIYFLSEQNGPSEFWVSDATGSNRRRIATAGKDVGLNLSPDEQWLTYATGAAIERISTVDGRLEKLFAGNTGSVSYSPDGRTIAFVQMVGDSAAPEFTIATLPATGGKEPKFFPVIGPTIRMVPPKFSADGNSLTFSAASDGADNLWIQSLAGGKTLQLTKFDSGTINDLEYAPDFKSLVVSRSTFGGDVVLLKCEEGC